MNGICFALGGALLTKLLYRRITGFEPHRHSDERAKKSYFWRVFLCLNTLVLAYCLISAVNARATFDLYKQTFIYHENIITWLPSSYDSALTWFAFWQYLGLFCFFWAVRDWLLGKSKREISGALKDLHSVATPMARAWRLPDRLKLLLWVISINGSVLAVEGVLQRVDGTPKLLWLRESWWGTAATSFGPYSYRANAAQYFNLVWPVALGFWWLLKKDYKSRNFGYKKDNPSVVLVPGVVLMATCPIISLSRGGALIAAFFVGVIVVSTILSKRTRGLAKPGVLVFALLVFGFSVYLGLDKLLPRFREIGTLSGRTEIYANAKKIAEEFPVFGTGPGTFRSVYQLYRNEAQQEWHAFAHDDWLETRVTFGWIGFVLVALHLVLLFFGSWTEKGIRLPVEFGGLLALPLVGCLLHARFDFPFQTYSVLHMFITISAMLVVTYPEVAGSPEGS